MRCGISTACFYPENTLDSLKNVVETGAPVTEIFLNTFRELDDDFVALLKGEIQSSGIKVAALHPFSSAMEGFFFASDYQGRLEDGIKLYKRYFEVCQHLGVDKLVFHGDHAANSNHFTMDQYTTRVYALTELGAKYNVTLCHENVAYCRLNTPDVVAEYRQKMRNKAAFVLDTKQAHRVQVDVPSMLEAMGKDIKHIHISDYSEKQECLPPGNGQFDVTGLLHKLAKQDYRGDIIVELYRDNFLDQKELVKAMNHVTACCRFTK